MTTQTFSATDKPAYGPNIVRTWFDTVIQPILRGIEREKKWLFLGDYSYRFQPERLDYFDKVENHVDAEFRPNLTQFFSFFKEALDLALQHDRALDNLFLSCRAYHRAICENKDFLDTFGRIAERIPAELGGAVGDQFGAYRTEEEFVAVLAQYVVNNNVTLSEHYVTARLWNAHGGEFLRAASQPDLDPYRFELRKSAEALFAAIASLAVVLEDTQQSLSLQMDVPLVPAAGAP